MAEQPLTGTTVVEFAGLPPAPQAAWQLAELGATVVTVLRHGQQGGEHRTAAGQSRSRDAWAEVALLRDACRTPLLRYAEAMAHPHVVARGIPRSLGGRTLPSSAPFFLAVEQLDSVKSARIEPHFSH